MNRFFTSVFSILLVVAMLAPTLVKLSHALLEHQEQVCQEVGSVHVHEFEMDCDFQKFNLSPQIYPCFNEFDVSYTNTLRKETFNYYSFLSKYQKLHFALRGPPVS